MTSSASSAITARARAFVAAKTPDAVALGAELAGLIADPEAFVERLETGFRALGDPPYRDAQAWMVPGGGPVLGVRRPLMDATATSVRRELRGASAAYAIYLAERLVRSEYKEVRLFAHYAIERALPDDPERSWQLIRRIARRANDWETIDNLANVVVAGIVREPYRWAEIEQLVYSPHRWERRLVGSAIATIPFAVPRERRRDIVDAPALSLIRSLIGDGDADVQKALSWALRSWAQVDSAGVEQLLREETGVAAENGDGHRAWVVRDTLSAVPADVAAELKAQLAGVRRTRTMPSTSRASEVSRSFAGLPDAHDLAEAPLS